MTLQGIEIWYDDSLNKCYWGKHKCVYYGLLSVGFQLWRRAAFYFNWCLPNSYYWITIQSLGPVQALPVPIMKTGRWRIVADLRLLFH